MRDESWKERIERWRGGGPIEADLTSYREILREVNSLGESLIGQSDEALQAQMMELKLRVRQGEPLDDYWIEVLALVREAAARTVDLRPFDVQVLAGIALDAGKLVEMQTGEGKTLAAVLPACLNALSGKGVHILTFNDYLARRDAAWMGPVYRFLGLSVGVIQEGMDVSQRKAAYALDVTYATAKEAGFDFLRGHLCRSPDELVQRPFHYAIVDEADSLLIDEARIPLVIAGELPTSGTDPYKTGLYLILDPRLLSRQLPPGPDQQAVRNGRLTRDIDGFQSLVLRETLPRNGFSYNGHFPRAKVNVQTDVDVLSFPCSFDILSHGDKP